MFSLRGKGKRGVGLNPVIFVHGIGASAKVWKKFGMPERNSYYLSFSNCFASPQDQVPELKLEIERILKSEKKERVILVCHSMGGLVARKYLVDYSASHKVEKLILLSTPNLGSRYWFLFLSPAAWAMRPDSKFLRELNKQKLPNDVKYLAVLSDTKDLPHRLVNLFLFREGGDGAVPLSSQKLSLKCVPNFSELNYSELQVSLPHFAIPHQAGEAILQALEL